MSELDDYGKRVLGGYVNPTIIEERQLNIAQMDVYSRLMMDRIIVFGSEVDDVSCNIVTSQMLYLDSVDPGKEIAMYINSGGGSVYSGYGVIDTMDFISSPVSTQVLGLAASMAAMFAVCGERDHRYLLPHSRFMIHQPMGGVPGGTQASDIEINCKEILKIKEELIEILMERSGNSREDVEKAIDRDTWFRGQEAVDAGYLDGVRKKNG